MKTEVKLVLFREEPESGVLNDDDAELTFNAPALLPHNSAIAYLGIPSRQRCCSDYGTFPDEFVKTWAPKWMEILTKWFRKLFEKDFCSHDKAINDESPVMPIVNNS